MDERDERQQMKDFLPRLINQESQEQDKASLSHYLSLPLFLTQTQHPNHYSMCLTAYSTYHANALIDMVIYTQTLTDHSHSHPYVNTLI